jgi:hypothetical protein
MQQKKNAPLVSPSFPISPLHAAMFLLRSLFVSSMLCLEIDRAGEEPVSGANFMFVMVSNLPHINLDF